MKLELNGTGAAEAIPAPFCRCRVCSEARKRRGQEIRGRSSALLDSVVQVDFGPDVVSHAQQFGRDLSAITTLLYTHHHDDHLIPAELQYRGPWFVTDTELPLLNVYGNELVHDLIRTFITKSPFSEEQLRLVLNDPLIPFQSVEAPDGTVVLPLPADHAPQSLVLRIQREGKSIFYGHDSGLYPDETLRALQGVPLDAALFDSTSGLARTSNRGHMDVTGVLESIKRLRDAGAVTIDTQLIATHFSHNGGALHDELRERLEPEGVIVAYDGMVLEI
jgi:phosphoribosyl 1,2-cyclic phosphate phosphodiesterase